MWEGGGSADEDACGASPQPYLDQVAGWPVQSSLARGESGLELCQRFVIVLFSTYRQNQCPSLRLHSL